MAKERDYAAEYRRRTRQKRGQRVPSAVLRGHGTLPAGLARKLEAGTITKTERRRYAKAIAGYEARYGPAGHGRAGRERKVPMRFASRRAAEVWLEDKGIPKPYANVNEVGGSWTVTVLR